MLKRRLFISLIFVLKMTVTIFRGGGVTPKIVSNLKAVIFNSNEAWHLGDDKIKPTETKRLPFLQAINYI